MTFNIIAMICVAGMSPADCGPEPGFSRDVAVIGQVSNELWCLGEAQMDAAKRRSATSPKASSSRSCASETADDAYPPPRNAGEGDRPKDGGGGAGPVGFSFKQRSIDDS
jgi:hypothetical protein